MTTNHLLLVDDEKDFEDVVKGMLVGEPYHLIFCKDSVQAPFVLKEHQFDAVLLDLRMPKLEGGELLQLIKKRYPNLPIILVSAFITPENSKHYMSLGAFDLLTKPLCREQLLDVLKRATQQQTNLQMMLSCLNLYDAKNLLERKLIVKALTQSNGNKTHASKLLGISRFTLSRMMNRYQIKY